MPDQPTSRMGPRATHLAQARCRDIRPGPRGTIGKFHPLDNPVDVHSSTGCRIVKPVFDRDLVRTVAGRLQPIATGKKRPKAAARRILRSGCAAPRMLRQAATVFSYHLSYPESRQS